MTNQSHHSFLTLREAIISIGHEWQEKDFYFYHGVLPIIDNAITDTKDYVGILLCTDGDIDISINQVDYNITSSTLLIAYPSSIIQVIRSKGEYHGILLFVSRDFLAKHILNTQLVKPFRQITNHQYTLAHITREEQQVLIDIYKLIHRKSNTKNSLFQLETLRNLFLVFVCEVAEIFLKSKKVETHSTRNEEITDAFLNLLTQPIKASHKTAYFANKLHISPKHLIKAIKTTTGNSPGIFINKQLIDNAKLLLANNQLTIAQVSRELGFSETASFSSSFKKQTGQTPTQYRNLKPK